MAKRKQARARAPKTETLTLNLPREVWAVILEASHVSGLTTNQVMTAILAVGLSARMKKTP